MEYVTAFLGILGTIAGLAALLGKKYFEKEMELEGLRKSNILLAISELRETVDDHKGAIRAHSEKLEKVNTSILRTDMDNKKLGESFRELAESHDARIIAFEQKIIKLTEDLWLFKGKPRQ